MAAVTVHDQDVFYPRTVPSFPALEDVRDLRVDEAHPPTSNANGMDFDRCSALHNAIIKHNWLATGHELADLPRTTWFQAEYNIPHLAEVESKLHPSVVDFLRRAFVVNSFPDDPRENKFFYYCDDLGDVGTMFDCYEMYRESGDDRIALYVAGKFKVKYRDGLVYDQSTHMTLYNEYDPMDLQYSEKSLPWQPLESVLSVWLDIIERGKAVALHKSVQEAPPVFQVTQLDGSLSEMYVFPPAQPLQDPATGAKRAGMVYGPWVVVPYTSKDLQDTLEVWDQLIQAIEEKMPPLPPNADGTHGLFDDSILRDADMLNDGFATRLFKAARKPRCKFLGPGLRLPTSDELTSGPFRDLGDNDMPIKPIPILLADSMARTPWFWHQVDRIPAGLYFDGCEREGASPFEDGSRLVLPYPIGGNGFAKTSDGASINHVIGNSELYQQGWNPFILQHPIQLRAILNKFQAYVRTGMWSVGVDGVTDPIELFQQADANEASWNNASHPGYICEIGPGDGF